MAPSRPTLAEPVEWKVPVAGSYSSADVYGSTRLAAPPAIRTSPFPEQRGRGITSGHAHRTGQTELACGRIVEFRGGGVVLLRIDSPGDQDHAIVEEFAVLEPARGKFIDPVAWKLPDFGATLRRIRSRPRPRLAPGRPSIAWRLDLSVGWSWNPSS